MAIVAIVGSRIVILMNFWIYIIDHQDLKIFSNINRRQYPSPISVTNMVLALELFLKFENYQVYRVCR